MPSRGRGWLVLIAVVLVGGFSMWGKMLKSSQYPIDWRDAAGAVAGAALIAWLVWISRRA